MTNLIKNLGSPLLRPILFAVIAIIVIQTLTLLGVTRSNINTLVTSTGNTLTAGSQQMEQRLQHAEQTIRNSIETLTDKTSNTLTSTLERRLSKEQQQVAGLLTDATRQTANALAELMAIASPQAIWDKDTPALTQLVRNLHRNPNVVFARYYDADGKPLTRHLDKRLAKVKELIRNGQGRRTMDKVMNAARKDPEIYLVEVDINPRGAVIGRFILAVSSKQALDASLALEQRFDRLISTSRMAVAMEINGQAQNTQQTLQQAVEDTLTSNQQINQQAAQTMIDSASTLAEKMTAIMTGLGILMIALLATIMSMRIITKLTALTSALRELATGDGDLTRRIEIKSRDEIGTMAATINSFIEKTQQLVLQATQAANSTAGRIKDINQSCSSAHQAVNQQNEQLQQTSVAITQMSLTTEQVAERIQHNLSNVDEVRLAGQEAGSISRNVRDNIRQLGTEVRGAADVVNNVASQSEEINAILDVIKGIAEQTNLLALNAAIEAARAGERGRGFAVVADEVRDLASKTQASTENIQQQINALQEQVSSAVGVINSASDNAEASISAINDSDQKIQDISSAVQRLYDFTHDIAAMAEEQAQVSHEITRSVEKISSHAGTTADAVRDNANTADDLNTLSHSLKTTLGQFRV